MENFVLNLFSDQLSKVILNFNDAKMKINANFMAGKGSITNVKLNVDLINDFLNKPPHGVLPYLQLSEVTLSELRLEVTSYTNLKKAPVVLVIDEIHAHAVEPLEYYFDGKNNAQNQNASAANATSAAYKQQYGLLQRIQDNLSVRVNKINFTFQPLGKFKTRRVGPWTPPLVMVTLKNVEWISVTEMGSVGTPEMVWAHNDLSAQQSRMRRDAAARTSGHQHRTYTIFKRLTMIGCVRLVDADQSRPKTNDGTGRSSRSLLLESPMIISDCNIEMHVAYLRRLRDAAITGVDVDILCRDVDICLDLSPLQSSADIENNSSQPLGCSLQSLIHFMAGLQHCVYKDRSFVDPLLPENTYRPSDDEKMLTENKRLHVVDEVENKAEELGPDDFMPTINVEDDDLDESSEDGEEPDEEHDQAFLAWKREQGLEVEASASDPINTVLVDTPDGVIRKEGSSHSLRRSLQNSDNDNDNDGPSKYKRKRKAVIVLARGAQKFEKLSFSLALRRVIAKLYLPQNEHAMEKQKIVSSNTSSYRHCLELLAEGAVIECIWPKPSGEIGGNVQCSLRYLHVMEVVHRLSGLSSDVPKDGSIVKYSALMRVGTKLVHRDVFSLSSHWNRILWRGTTADETLDDDDDDQGFPVMTSRPVSWKWTRSSNASSHSAISLKSTVSFVDENLALWSQTKVVHEASIGKIEVCFDSSPLGRLIEVIVSVPLNDRWFSGEWSNDFTSNMLAEEAQNGVFSLKNHIQPLPGWSNGKLSALSSDLRSITARFGGFVMRMPHSVNRFSSCGSAETVFSASKATLLVSSELPVSFLTGTITASDGTSKSFPNDERDISCRDGESGLGSEAVAKFRLQVTLSDFSLKVVPMQHVYLASDESNINHLIVPTKITIMTNLEHANALQQSSGNESDARQSFVASVLIQRLESNIALGRAISATSTLNYHITEIMRHAYSRSPDSSDEPLCTKSQLAGETEDCSTKTILVVCLHVPELEFNMFEDRTHPQGLLHLSRLLLRQVEFGFESTCGLSENYGDRTTTLYKCVLEGFAFQVISKEYNLIDFVTTGIGASNVAASVKSFLHHNEVKTQSGGNVMIRVLHNSLQREVLGSSVQTSTSVMDISSLVVVSLDIDTIKMFSEFVIGALSTPVYFYARSTRANAFESIAQSTISALWSSLSELMALSQSSDAGCCETDTAFTRLLLSNLLVQVPNTSLSTNDANFWFSFDAVELAYCYAGSMKECADLLFEQRCGRGDDWRTVLGDATDCNSFYLLKSRLSVLIADGDIYRFVFPPFSVDWSSTRGDVQINDFIESFLSVGTVLSSATMKLFYLLPSASSKSSMTSTAKEMHNMIAKYHSKVMTIFYDLEDKVERMRLFLFVKERERVAMPVACGWLRISERSELSFHRLFATATLFRYWAVLNNSLMVFYENPGSSRPTLIFPITALSTSIRKISLPGTPGIVGTHLQQKGFALIDSATGSELFCVAGSRDELTTWVSAIAFQLRQDTTASSSPGNEAFALDSSSVKHELAGEVANEISSSLRVTDDFVNDPNISISDKSNQDVVDLRTPEDEALSSSSLIEILNEDPVASDDPNFIPSNDLELESDEMETIALDKMELPYTTSASASTPSDTPPDPIFGPVIISNSELKDNAWPSTHRQAEPFSAINVQRSVSRDLLKSKFASSKFSSALKTAKGGVIAASEIGRDSLRQALSNDGSAHNNTSTNNEANRSVLAGHKLSALKKTANTKIVKLGATVRSSVQEHSTHSIHAQKVVAETSSHVSTRRQDCDANSTDNSGHEAALGTSDLSDISNTLCDLNQSSRQDQIRKKLATLDQSMVSTMRRLKIDEKLNNISTVVKNVAESRGVNISQPRNGDHRLHKSIKFDARETFEYHSVLPVKIKAIKPGSSIILNDDVLSEKCMELSKIQGNWIIDVEVTSCLVHTSEADTEVSNSTIFRSDEHVDAFVDAQSSHVGNICLGSKQWTYKVTSTEIGNGGSAEKVRYVEKSLSDILLLHTLISETLSSHYSCAATVTFQEATQGIDSLNPAFQRMPPLERIKVSGSVLQGILDASKLSIDSDSIRKSHCELIRVFLYTLITSYLPKFAIQVTEEFLDIASLSKTSVHQRCLTETTQVLDDALGCVSNHVDEIKQSPSVHSHLKACGESSFIISSLLDTIMSAYSKVTHERDEALASLAAASILKDNEIFLKYMATDLGTVTTPTTHMQQNIDDEMQMLCKNLGQEIGLRTKAEAEVLSLKQRLELEQKLAKAKQDDLMVELEKYKSLLESMSSRK
ncbi:hypothetical protein HJC23_003702 [Cyclotella cryptica]|uniref:PH domain-containing protein n=1 Tax=Cyclotella cryptica TaxID=29204 RepID=A0ABD3QTV3_9STRA